MGPDLEIEEAVQRKDLVFIDVRSPAEFSEASIPGAKNIPLFDDDQHRELGLVYHREGEAAARRTALALVSPRLPALVDQIAAAAAGRIPLLYCWRGGLRSLSLCQILNLAGLPARRLKGGYRAYRRYLNRRLESYRLQSKLIVLHGLAGVGKTAVIEELIRRGRPAVDLEGLALHRGSVFGALGFTAQHSQKDFDALLLQQLELLDGSPYIIVEGEGRRIGNVQLPPFFARAMEEGIHLLLTAPLADRVNRIVREYLPPRPSARELEQIREALGSLRRRLGAAKTELLLDHLSGKEYYAVAEILCTDYYDRLYGDARPERHPFAAAIDTTDISAAADRLTALREELISTGVIQQKGVLAGESV